jgi:uncharacterized protein YuzE
MKESWMPVTAEYDHEADALYVRLRDGARQRAVEVDQVTYVDLDEDGQPLGIELLYPSRGINLDAVLARFVLQQQMHAIAGAIAQSGAPIAAPTYTGGTRLATTTITTMTVEGTVAAAFGSVEPSVAHADPFMSVG